MRHGDLLVFIGGNVAHSMFPATEAPWFNPNGRDWRFSITFRWTTDAIRKYGPGKRANAATRYDKSRASGFPRGLYFLASAGPDDCSEANGTVDRAHDRIE